MRFFDDFDDLFGVVGDPEQGQLVGADVAPPSSVSFIQLSRPDQYSLPARR
jgi:hypothetical protein